MSNETRDTVFIGKKPLMAYVTSTLIQLANLPSVNIKGYSIGEIKIGSESLESQDGRTRNVSTIEIEVKRNTN
jgi:DNA-binding protein